MKTPFAIGFLSHWLPWQKTRLVQQVAGEVARQCRASLWQYLGHKTTMMSISEIRGYVRAHAIGFVGNEVDRACLRRRIGLSLRAQVAAAAVEQLITMVIHDVLCEQPPCDIKTMAA
jgi:hypothetical protein